MIPPGKKAPAGIGSSIPSYPEFLPSPSAWSGETRGMFNLEKFSRMKKSALIVNTSRGPVVRTQDLIEALKRGMIAGAGLDVFEKEPPPPDLELLQMSNAVLSPHIAWYSEEGGWDIRVMIIDDVKACLAGKPPRHVVNKEVLTRPNLRFKLSANPLT